MDGAWALYEAWVRLQHGDIDTTVAAKLCWRWVHLNELGVRRQQWRLAVVQTEVQLLAKDEDQVSLFDEVGGLVLAKVEKAHAVGVVI